VLSKALLASWTVLFICAFTIVAQAPSPPHRVDKQTKADGHAGEAAKGNKDGGFPVGEIPEKPAEDTKKRADNKPEYWRSAFAPPTWSNWALFFAAIAAAFIANKTLNTLQGQIRVARDTLIAAHPPRLIVRNVSMRSKAQDNSGVLLDVFMDDDPPGHFYVENVGGTDAKITRRYVMMCQMMRDAIPAERPYEGKVGEAFDIIIAPGESKRMEFPLGKAEVIALPPGFTLASLDLYLLGWINYADGSGHVRTAIFCRRLARGGRFQPVNDPEYENAS
jgi:hypothetical protein